MYTLEVTQDINDIRERQAINHPSWGMPLSLDAYQYRDGVNYYHPYMNLERSDGANGVIYFLLRNDETGNVESACEVLIRDAWLKDEDGTLKDVKCGVLGSVFTDPKFRGKGNANVLMTKFNLKMKEFLKDENDILFLYSEIGEYYAKFGYCSENVPVWQLKSADTKELWDDASSQWEKVTPVHFKRIADDYAERLQKIMRDHTGKSSGSAFCVRPTGDILEWFANRARVTQWGIKLVGEDFPRPPCVKNYKENEHPSDDLVYGLYLEDEYIVWQPEFKSDKILILMINAKSIERVRYLLERARAYAHFSGISKVEIWRDEVLDFNNSGNKLTLAAPEVSALLSQLKADEILENESLGALKWVHNDGPRTNITWIGNGKWCWF